MRLRQQSSRTQMKVSRLRKGGTAILDDDGGREIRRELKTHHTRCLPLGIARTALTAPLPGGNFKVLSGSQPRFAL